jgi:hypothetical protein
MALEPIERAGLRQFLENRFDLNDLKTLAFDLSVDFQLFSHETKRELSLGLIAYFEHRDQLSCLVTEVLRWRCDNDLAQMLTKLPPYSPSTKVQIIVSEDLLDDFSELLEKLAMKLKVSKDEVVLIGAAWGSMRLLVGLPEKAADLRVLSEIRSLGDDKYQIVSIAAFDSLEPASQKAWLLVARDWPPVRRGDVLHPIISWMDALEATRKASLNMPIKAYDATILREFLVEYFSLEDLRNLCQDLKVSFGSLGGEGKKGKARELVRYMKHRSWLDNLASALERERPKAWQGLLEPTPRPEPVPYAPRPKLVPYAPQPSSPLRESWNWLSRHSIVSIAIVCIIVVIITALFFQPLRTPPPTPISPPADVAGKVCMIKSGWDTNTIFLRQAEFDALGLPIGTRATVTVRDTGKSIEGVTLSLNSSLKVCSVQLSQPLREALEIDEDTFIKPQSERPDRKFDITQIAPPTNKENINFSGKVCMIKKEHDVDTLFLRQTEFNDLYVPAGTTVSITVHDTGETIKEINLSLDKDLEICAIRLSEDYRKVLGVNDDTKIEPVSSRPDRQISVAIPRP